MPKKKRVAGALMEHGGKLLLLHRDDGRWGLPAGGVEPGEDDLTAAVREIFEETGYKAKKKDMHFLFIYERPSRAKEADNGFTFILFRLAVPSQFDPKLDPKEHTDFRWVTPKEAIEMPKTIPGLVDVFKKAYNLK